MANSGSQPSRPSATTLLLCCILLLLTVPMVGAEPLRMQSVVLQKGWNAVHLEVDPAEKKPDLLFANQPIDVVARYFTLVTAVQFMTDPADEPWKTKGWGVWYAPDREDAFLTSLHAIQGNQCYLIHATADTTWQVTGTVRLKQVKWKAGSFNLFGTCVDEQSPPTFGEFFSGAGGEIGSLIYRLAEGKWVKVTNPEGTRMRAGEACWIHCSGKTGYQGPLEVTGPGVDGLVFGVAGAEREITVRNNLPEPVDVTVEPVASSVGEPPSLNRVVLDLSKLETSYLRFEDPEPFPAIGGESGFRFKLQSSPEDSIVEPQSALLKVTSSVGVVVWVPLTATTLTPVSGN